jgi:SMC interacting uncharacterized protein involved in chromosome segregation
MQARPECFDDKQRSETDFFEYVAKSYKFFLAGDDYQCQLVDEEKAQEFEQRAFAIREQNMLLQQVASTGMQLALRLLPDRLQAADYASQRKFAHDAAQSCQLSRRNSHNLQPSHCLHCKHSRCCHDIAAGRMRFSQH